MDSKRRSALVIGASRQPTPRSILPSLNQKNIFLFDGIGAIASAIGMGIILPMLQSWVGMPLNVLFSLAFYAVCCMTYSLLCYRFADHANSNWLKGILAANLLYCCVSGWLMFKFFDVLTLPGMIYFVGEKLVVLAVFWLELNVLRSTKVG